MIRPPKNLPGRPGCSETGTRPDTSALSARLFFLPDRFRGHHAYLGGLLFSLARARARAWASPNCAHGPTRAPGMSSVGEARHLQAPVADMNRLVTPVCAPFARGLTLAHQAREALRALVLPGAWSAATEARRKRQL